MSKNRSILLFGAVSLILSGMVKNDAWGCADPVDEARVSRTFNTANAKITADAIMAGDANESEDTMTMDQAQIILKNLKHKLQQLQKNGNNDEDTGKPKSRKSQNNGNNNGNPARLEEIASLKDQISRLEYWVTHTEKKPNVRF